MEAKEKAWHSLKSPLGFCLRKDLSHLLVLLHSIVPNVATHTCKVETKRDLQADLKVISALRTGFPGNKSNS